MKCFAIKINALVLEDFLGELKKMPAQYQKYQIEDMEVLDITEEKQKQSIRKVDDEKLLVIKFKDKG